MVTVLDKPTTLKIMDQREELPIERLEEEHPNEWLLIEITREKSGHPLAGQLIATAVDDAELVELGRQYDRKKVPTFITHGSYRQPLPEVVA
jgi:hypothetical protein